MTGNQESTLQHSMIAGVDTSLAPAVLGGMLCLQWSSVYMLFMRWYFL
jgi:hypothetical protein